MVKKSIEDFCSSPRINGPRGFFCDQIHSKILFVKMENDVINFVMIFITRFITRFITLKMSNMKASDELAIVSRRPQGLNILILDNKRSERSSAIIWLLNPP